MSSYIGKEPTYGVFIMQSATGDGSTTAITLNATAADATQLMVSVGGLLQKPRTAYTLNTAGTTLTFSEAPASGVEIFIVFLGKQLTGPRIMADSITAQTALGTTPADDDYFLIYDTSASDLKKVEKQYVSQTLTYTTRSFTGDGSTTAFTISASRTVDDLLVFLNGVAMKPTTDYTVAGTTLTMVGAAPASASSIVVRELPK
tara:strand:- start:466 stop:1074 length:609 start_codon:yes stop_codon:yes gene_type:complete